MLLVPRFSSQGRDRLCVDALKSRFDGKLVCAMVSKFGTEIKLVFQFNLFRKTGGVVPFLNTTSG